MPNPPNRYWEVSVLCCSRGCTVELAAAEANKAAGNATHSCDAHLVVRWRESAQS
jgi:hypothetical protein